MTTPVEQQLRAYFEHVDSVQEPAELPTVIADDDAARPRLVEHDPDATVVRVVDERRPIERLGRRRLLTAAAAAAALVLVIALVATSADDAELPADVPTPSLPGETLPPPEPVGDIGLPHTVVAPGRYDSFVLGVTVELTLAGEWLLPELRDGAITLQSPADRQAVDVTTVRWLMLSRLGGWNTPEEAVDRTFNGTGSIDPHDLDRWIEENDVLVTDRRAVEVDGRPALAFDVRVDPDGRSAPLDFARDPFLLFNETCDEDTAPCIWYRSLPEVNLVHGPRPDPVLHGQQIRRMWLIPITGFEPLLIEAVAPERDAAWLDEIESSMIATLEIGADAPPFSAN